MMQQLNQSAHDAQSVLMDDNTLLCNQLGQLWTCSIHSKTLSMNMQPSEINMDDYCVLLTKLHHRCISQLGVTINCSIGV